MRANDESKAKAKKSDNESIIILLFYFERKKEVHYLILEAPFTSKNGGNGFVGKKKKNSFDGENLY